MNALLANLDWGEIGLACLETLSMLGAALGFTVALGLPLGVLLFLTGQRQMLAKALNSPEVRQFILTRYKGQIAPGF